MNSLNKDFLSVALNKTLVNKLRLSCRCRRGVSLRIVVCFFFLDIDIQHNLILCDRDMIVSLKQKFI